MSVSGIRGKIGESLFAELYLTMAYLQTRSSGGGKILVGRDTRPTGAALARAAFRGIRLGGGVPVDIGIAPTPTACFAVKHFQASGGIIITASHNPLPYNGYKMVHRTGRLFNAQECDELYHEHAAHEYPSWDTLDTVDDSPSETLDAAPAHIERILAAVDIETIRSAGIKIAVDSINGAAATVFPHLLKRLRVEWKGVHNGLDGDFVHNPEPRPENLADLASLLRSEKDFWAGFAFDPDADRCALMGESGQPISEEMTLALALQTVLSRRPSPVATNLSTSMVIDDVAKEFGVEVIRTKIGEANVVEAMLRHGCLVGGEGNGGVIYPRVSTVRDGPTALALILELMAKSRKKITAVTSRWREYPIVKQKIPFGTADPARVIERLAKAFAGETVDMQDGLKVIRDYGWVHVRPSNTEPILRCYAEAQTKEQAQELAQSITSRM